MGGWRSEITERVGRLGLSRARNSVYSNYRCYPCRGIICCNIFTVTGVSLFTVILAAE